MNEREMLGLFDRFRLTGEEKEKIRCSFPQFGIYKKRGKSVECLCTACLTTSRLDAAAVKHGRDGTCPYCGQTIEFLSGGKIPAGSYYFRLNFVVFRAVDDMLLARAYTVEQRFEPVYLGGQGIAEYMPGLNFMEVQRYVFGGGGAVRFVVDESSAGGAIRKQWKPAKQLREPVFCTFNYYGRKDNCYLPISMSAEYKKSCMRWCGLDEYEASGGNYAINYLSRLAKYPALEKLTKCGFERIVYEMVKPENAYDKRAAISLNLRADDPRRILRLDREEMELLRGCDPDTYLRWLEFRKLNIPGNTRRRFQIFRSFGKICSNIELIAITTRLSHIQIINYIKRQSEGNTARYYDTAGDWQDYLAQCRQLGYDVTDTAICKPRDLHERHARLSAMVEVKADLWHLAAFEAGKEWRRLLEYREDGYIIRQPESMEEIIIEGKLQHHCVGGYAPQHAGGTTTIMFLRKEDKPDKPYYTIEVGADLHIQQCRGYANNVISRGGVEKPQEIRELEKRYQQYLYSLDKEQLKRLKNNRTKVRKGA